MTEPDKATRKSAKAHRGLSIRDRDNLSWLWRDYLREKAGWFALVLVLVILQGFVYQQFLRLTEDGLRVIFEKGALRDLVIVCLTVFGVIAFRGAMSFAVPRISVWIAADAIMKLRRNLIEHLLRLDLAYFDRTKPGETIVRLTNQVESISLFLGQATVSAVRDFFTIIIISGYLLWKQPMLFIASALVLPVIITALQKIITNRIRAAQLENQKATKGYVSALEETVTGVRTVKISGQEAVEQDRLNGFAGILRRKQIEVQSLQALTISFVDFAAAIVYALVIGGGGYMVLSPDFDLDGAAIMAFLIGLVLVFDPGRRLAHYFTGLQANLVILDIVRQLFDQKPQIADRADAVSSFDPRADIVFEDVAFSYSQDAPLFRKLDLTFKGGQTTAIVGPTGSGKTTVLSLLSRLYEIAGGRVRIGDIDIMDIRIRDLRNAFSVVAQDIVIFDSSIYENIRYVRPDASHADIQAAAEAAEIVALMAQRGDASVGPKGSQLSGGQRQRIAIARAFLCNAPVILLDEATSALDQATEERIRGALDRLSKGRTTIVVAHRLSSVKDAGHIYVLESGAVSETGTHDDLMRAGGLYAGLYEAQKSGYDKEP